MSRRSFISYEFSFKHETVKLTVDNKYGDLRTIKKRTHAHIVKAVNKNNQNVVAMKKTQQLNDPDDARRIYRECVLLRTIQHKNLITLLDTFIPADSNDLYLVSESMEVSMRELLRLPSTDPRNLKNMVWNPNNGDHFTANVMFQMFRGLQYLHQDKLEFIHQDIKPENILLKQSTEGNWLLKICDLGLAEQLMGKNLTNYMTTYSYRAPEVII
ncbi:hypothetical protein FO519_009753, partial [Halicephalobus sp. NKZ332]